MKFLVIILLGIALYGNTSDTYAWVSTAAKYMPLQVGNVWVYYSVMHSPARGPDVVSYVKYKINGITDTLGRKYFRLQKTIINVTGNTVCYLLPSLLRIDSSNMNIYSPGLGCYGSELILDSLLSQKGDTSKCSLSNIICTDTSTITAFNIPFKSKHFINDIFVELTFCRGIGVYRYNSFGANSWCVDSLRGCVIDGILYGDTSIIVGLNNISFDIPENFELSQNYPNPFNPSTHFGFRIADFGLVKLTIYDALGKEVAILINEQLQPGSYEAHWDASTYPSGVYYYKLESGSFTETRKMVLIK
ncbi:MAG: T9SS type A sorting domain-containing protein [Ignavibacteria bacterium]